MNDYYGIYSENDWRLYHYGIKGQKWGVRNGPPYPIDRKKHPDIGNPNVIDGANVSNSPSSSYDKIVGELTREENARLANANGYSGNCKEAAFTYAQRVLNNDDVVAKAKTIDGNLHDFANEYFEDGDSQVKSVYGNGDTSEDNVTKQIEKSLRRGEYKDGDVGAVTVTIDEKYRNPNVLEDGHSFNWEIIDGEVNYRDGSGQTNATPSDYFKRVDPNIEMEIIDYANVNITKENADKIMENRNKK